MSATFTTRARRIASRIAETWSDLDHAQRRLFEIQTGTSAASRGRHPRPRGRDKG